MALYLGKSKRILQSLKSKISVVGLGENSFWSGWFHHGCPSSMAPSAPNCRNQGAVSIGTATQFPTRRFESTKAEKRVDSLCDAEDNQGLVDVAFTSEMRFIRESPMERAHCYRVLDGNGLPNMSKPVQVAKEVAVKMYAKLLTRSHFK